MVDEEHRYALLVVSSMRKEISVEKLAGPGHRMARPTPSGRSARVAHTTYTLTQTLAPVLPKKDRNSLYSRQISTFLIVAGQKSSVLFKISFWKVQPFHCSFVSLPSPERSKCLCNCHLADLSWELHWAVLKDTGNKSAPRFFRSDRTLLQIIIATLRGDSSQPLLSRGELYQWGINHSCIIIYKSKYCNHGINTTLVSALVFRRKIWSGRWHS